MQVSEVCAQTDTSVEVSKKNAENSDYLGKMAFVAENLGEDEPYLRVDDGKTQLTERRGLKISIPKLAPETRQLSATEVFEKVKKSTVIFGTAYKCNKCDDTHMSHASGYIISEDGICVTNYHVLRGYVVETAGNKSMALLVMLSDGRVFPVKEVLVCSEVNDLAVVKIDTGGDKLPALALGEAAKEGAQLFVLSHPRRLFYYFSNGMVAHNFISSSVSKDGEFRSTMAITADYAAGSSGGPVVDIYGNLIGTVSSTNSIYYDQQRQTNLQMVVKNTVPVSCLKSLLILE